MLQRGVGHYRPAPSPTCNHCNKMLSPHISLGFCASTFPFSGNTLIWMKNHYNIIYIIWNIAG